MVIMFDLVDCITGMFAEYLRWQKGQTISLSCILDITTMASSSSIPMNVYTYLS